MILAIWISSFISVSLLLYAMTTQEIDAVIYCYEDWSPLFDQVTAAKFYMVAMFVFLYAFPCWPSVYSTPASCTRCGFAQCPSTAAQTEQQRQLPARKSSRCWSLWLWSSRCAGFRCPSLFSFIFFKRKSIFAEYRRRGLALGQLAFFSAMPPRQLTLVSMWHSSKIFETDFEIFYHRVAAPVN